MTKIREVLDLFNQRAPLPLQADYDNAGLIVGNTDNEIKGCFVSVDCTEEVIDEAIKLGCNMVVSHHPILFRPISSLTGKNYVERTLIKAIKNDVAICAMHTNLDSTTDGVNAKICDKLNLTDRSILRPVDGQLRKLVTFTPEAKAEEVRNALFEAGAGHIGNYDHCSFNASGQGSFRGGDETDPYVGKKGEDHFENEVRIETVYREFDEKNIINALIKSHPYEEVAYDIYKLENSDNQYGAGMYGKLDKAMAFNDFLKLVKSTFNAGVIRHTGMVNEKVEKVAVCGGSGFFLLKDAIKSGADVFVTADIKYHEFFDADGKICLMDIGHFESEQFTVEILGEILTENFNTFATHFSDVNTNPINYF